MRRLTFVYGFRSPNHKAEYTIPSTEFTPIDVYEFRVWWPEMNGSRNPMPSGTTYNLDIAMDL